MENPFDIILSRLAAIENKIDSIQQRNNSNVSSRVGGIELAEEITGFKPSYIRSLSQRGELPTASGKHEKLRFDEKTLRNWMLARGRKTTTQLEQEVKQEYKSFKRLRN